MNMPFDTEWFCVDLPTMAYTEAWTLQGRLVAARKKTALDTDLVLLLEHPPVFTLGRRGGLNNLKVSKASLKAAGIPVIQVERGGDITFHGPGQLIMYPILDLQKARLTVTDYVKSLEEIMIRLGRDYGVEAERNPRNRGVWVGARKLGSIGVAIRKGISFHGMALNVNPSLEPFQWIHPCGLQDVGITSIAEEGTIDVSVDQARHRIREHIETVFHVKLVTLGWSELQTLLMGF